MGKHLYSTMAAAAVVAAGMLLSGSSGTQPANVLISSGFGTTTLNLPGVPLFNPTFPNVSVINGQVTGDVDLYTVPANRMAICNGGGTASNSTAGTITVKSELKSGGNYYLTGAAAPAATTFGTALTATASNTPIILLAGESYSLNISAVGISAWTPCVEFSASGPLKRTAMILPATGDNVALLAGAKTLHVLTTVYWNNTGGTRTLNGYAVPSGLAVDNTTKMKNAVSVGTGSVTSSALTSPTAASQGALALQPGDKLVLNVDANTAGQGFYTVYLQY